MSEGYQALTEKEKQTLRLLLAGHDAKSMARQLDLSVHTINERLRFARRKLSASSSREAARLLRAAEVPHPESLGDKDFGDAGAAADRQLDGEPEDRPHAAVRRLWLIGGPVMLTTIFAMLVFAASPQAAPNGASSGRTSTEAVPNSAAVDTARSWLALVDASKWQESFAATTRSFQTSNTVQRWQSASEQARVPLGAMLSRTAISDHDVPAAPAGVRAVRFRTDFANKAGAIETVSLVREDGEWRIAGIYID